MWYFYYMNDCIFCKIVRGEIRIDGHVFENDHVLAFLSTGPIHPGHTLVIPKIHSDQIYQISDETASAIGIALKTISSMVKKAVAADGINIHMNNEKGAGQEVFHAHIHIIPRYYKDGYKNWEPGYTYKAGEIATLAKKIREGI